MTLISTIVRDAYRESNLIAITRDPTTEELAEGLRLLNRLILSVYGNEAGEHFGDIPLGRNNVVVPTTNFTDIPSSTYLPFNVRLVLNLTEATTVNLHPHPQDGTRFGFVDTSGNLPTYNLTINGNGRTIEGETSVVKDVSGDYAQYMFQAETGNWGKVSPLFLESDFPFPMEFEDLFIIGLAMRLNPRHGATADPQSVQSYRQLLRDFKSRYRQSREIRSEYGIIFLTGVGRYMRNYLSSDSSFNTGFTTSITTDIDTF